MRDIEASLARFNTKWELSYESCHIWIAAVDDDGYGWFWADGKNRRAHRWFFLVTHGWLPPEILHECDTPACVREEHLIPGTKSDNMRDMILKGRGRGQFVAIGSI